MDFVFHPVVRLAKMVSEELCLSGPAAIQGYPHGPLSLENSLQRSSLYFLIESPFIPASVPGFHSAVLLGLPDFLSG